MIQNFTIAGGWVWCERCRRHHQECYRCPKSDPVEVKNDPSLDGIRAYISKIEGVYTCLCVQCGKQFQSNNKREILCGCTNSKSGK